VYYFFLNAFAIALTVLRFTASNYPFGNLIVLRSDKCIYYIVWWSYYVPALGDYASKWL